MASWNGISGLLNFKIFWGSMTPDPPRDWRHRRASGLPPCTQISSYGHELWVSLCFADGIVSAEFRQTIQEHERKIKALEEKYEQKCKELGVRTPPFHSWEWSMSNFSCSLSLNITSHSMENLAFHSLLRWEIIIRQILTTSLIHHLLKNVGRMYFLSLGVKGLTSSKQTNIGWFEIFT